MAQEKKSFMLYFDYREHLALLNDEERGRLLMALFDYGEYGTDPELDGAPRMAFSFIRAQMDRDNEKWETKARAGRQGGLSSGASRRASQSTPKQNEADASERSVTGTVTVTDTGTVTGTDIPPEPPEGAESEPVPFSEIQKLYNATCSSFPKIKAIEGPRKKAVAARWKTYPDIGTFSTLFKKTQASTFLKGGNDRNWSATFDWIMKANNMAKVLEGNYDDERRAKHGADQQHPPENDGRQPNLTGFEAATGDEDWGRPE